jgi:hypothetical protein
MWVCRAFAAVRGGSSPHSNSTRASADTTEPPCSPSIVRTARGQAEEIQEKLNVVVPREILRRPNPNSDIQRDADRRDRLLEEEDRKLGRKLTQMNSHADSSKETQVVDRTPSSISQYRVPRTENLRRWIDVIALRR